MEKFRIKTTELADGSKQYEPQVYTLVGIRGVWPALFHGSREILGWRSFRYQNRDTFRYLSGLHYNGFGDLDEKRVTEHHPGICSSTIEGAKKLIEDYIFGQRELVKLDRLLRKKDADKIIKKVTVIDVVPLLLLLILISLTSCNQIIDNSKPVTVSSYNTYGQVLCKYWCSQHDYSTGGSFSFELVDTCGKFQMGDEIIINKKQNR